MRVEIDAEHSMVAIIYLIILVIVIAGFTMVGKKFSPTDQSILTWKSWRQQIAYDAADEELEQYREDLLQLEAAFAEDSDPIAVSLLCAEILLRCQQGEVHLPAHRQLLIQAAEDVRDWAMGILEAEQASESITKAHELFFSP